MTAVYPARTNPVRDAGRALSRWERAADRWWHRSSSALTSASLMDIIGWDLSWQITAALTGAVFGGGRLSPDMDQYGPARWLRGRLRAAGWRWAVRLARALDHHRATHSVPVAAGVTLAAGLICWGHPMAWLIPLQWLWHDLGDALIGLRPHGLPGPGPAWGLTGHQRGLGLVRSGGRVCMAATVACWLTLAWLLTR